MSTASIGDRFTRDLPYRYSCVTTYKRICRDTIPILVRASTYYNKALNGPHSTYVAFYEDGRSTFSELAVYFGSVPSEHLDTLDERFKATIQRIIAEGLDMDRMSSVIARDRLKVCLINHN